MPGAVGDTVRNTRGHGCECAREPHTRRWFGPGSVNSRDMGGLPVRGGHFTRSGVVFRADAGVLPVPSLAVDLESRYGRVRVLDLRDAREVAAGSPLDRSIALHRFPFSDPEWKHDPQVPRGPDRFLEHYLRMLPVAYKAAGRLTQLMAESTSPVVVACRIGKDRTGLVMMVLLFMAGVPIQWIVRDFNLTARCYLANLSWVEGYAASRNESVGAVLRRFVLPTSVPRATAEHIAGQLRDRDAWPGLFGVDRITIDRAINRLVCKG
jgi:hypothetical protein